MNKKFELLREAVNTYKVNHCDGNKNEKELLEFIDELEQLTIPAVINSGKNTCSNCGDRGWLYDKDGRRTGTCPYHY